MKPRLRRSSRNRGSALISSLFIVAMTSLLGSGICLLAESHEARQRHEADYSLAMQLAEAGINYEINYYQNNSTVHTSASPYSGTLSGITGSYSVYSDSTSPTLVTATGTVGNITRKVTVAVSGSSVFNGAYAVFGTQGVTLNSNTITGTVGSNAAIAGSPSSSSSKTCTTQAHCTCNYDTCDNICNKQFANGWSTLSSSTCVNNQCSNMRCYYFSWLQVDSPQWTTPCNWPPAGTSKTTCTDSQISNYPGNTVILEPGDYYFTTCQIKSCNIKCDNGGVCCNNTNAGPCRIWCGGSDNTDDQFCSTIACTSSSQSLAPKCFYDKAHTCTISCSNQCCGFYGVKCGSSGSTNCCHMVLGTTSSPCTNYTGTCIADQVTLSSSASGTSNANISYNTDPTTNSQFGFSGSWQEVVANSGAVFADGTNN